MIRRKSTIAHEYLLKTTGVTENEKCLNCRFFHFQVTCKKISKCALCMLEGSNCETAWARNWQACGKFEKIIVSSLAIVDSNF